MAEHHQIIALVTGATGAIGKAIARQLAAKPNHTVVLIARNRDKAQSACMEIISFTGNQNVSFELANLSQKDSIRELAERWEGPLHILVNNAAVTPRRREETPQGIEMQWATNVLGYFWMMRFFEEILRKSAPARVVNVSSYWAGELDLADPEFKRRRYNNNEAYRQSKQANRMLAVAFAERLKTFDITVNACHPGDVNSTLSNNLGFGGHETPDQGALTPVWLATSVDTRHATGKYYAGLSEEYCHFGQDKKMIKELYNKCLTY